MSQTKEKQQAEQKQAEIRTKLSIICEAMGRYYASNGKGYNTNFTVYCEENGLEDDDEITAQLAEPTEDCLLCDFDDEFPFPDDIDDDDNKQFIYDLIQTCLVYPDIVFDCKSPKFDKDAFDIDEKELSKMDEMYQRQCPVLWNSGMNADICFKQILAIGRKYKYDYLQHLVSDYLCDRIEHIETSWTVKQWRKNHKHFRKLENELNIIKNEKPCDIVEHAVKSFEHRCCNKLLLQPHIKIDTSFEIICKYIHAAFVFISNVIGEAVKIKKAVCPFQIDICIATGKPKCVQVFEKYKKKDDDDDDDDDVNDNKKDKDDEDEKDDKYVDCIGDIEHKLKANGLKYTFGTNDNKGQYPHRIFTQTFNQFREENALGIQEDDKFSYPHKKRIIAFVDRRNGGQKDDVFVYQPPSNCLNIPTDAVSEWYLSSSKTCLLPNIEYGDGSKAERPNKNEKGEDKLKKSNIGSSFHCKGGLLTLSFHIQQQDVMKCFLYFNGQITRFMPKHIKTLLPKLFNMERQENKEYFNEREQEIDLLIQEINNIWRDDKYFRKFRQNL